MSSLPSCVVARSLPIWIHSTANARYVHSHLTNAIDFRSFAIATVCHSSDSENITENTVKMLHAAPSKGGGSNASRATGRDGKIRFEWLIGAAIKNANMYRALFAFASHIDGIWISSRANYSSLKWCAEQCQLHNPVMQNRSNRIAFQILTWNTNFNARRFCSTVLSTTPIAIGNKCSMISRMLNGSRMFEFSYNSFEYLLILAIP